MTSFAMLAFDLPRLLQLTLSLAIAFVLAMLIGAERQYRQRNAGLRTNVLVAIGAATFVAIGSRLNGPGGATQVAAYVVSGVGFLGAGVIMKDGGRISGLNTAATLWCSAAVGVLAGVGMLAEAVVVTVAILAGNTLLRPLVNAINRAPIDERAAEANFDVHAVTEPEHVAEVRDLMIEALERANYPVRDVEVVERSDELSELSASLVSTAIEPDELDAVAAELERSALVSHASWSASAEE